MKQLSLPLSQSADQLVKARFGEAGLRPLSIEKRAYPDETIFVVLVSSEDYAAAGSTGNAIDRELAAMNFKGFVTVRKAESASTATHALVGGVADSKVSELINLIAARSRTSEVQPSLEYIPDTARNIEAVLAPRHQLIFGRRGAGKTALMVEAKRRVIEEGNAFTWVNLQTFRQESSARAYMYICQRICDTIQSYYASRLTTTQVLATVSKLRGDLDSLLATGTQEVANLVPRVQQTIRRFLDASSIRFYFFIDELHYLARAEQPRFLDLIHGSVRDCDAWVKVAGIRHLSRWFQPHPPVGMQTGHDADAIDLDLTLENPRKAKNFLEAILASYAKKTGITRLSDLFSNPALDRLVLASGAVPRDFLVLSSGAIRQAQQREKGKVVGVQDVNKAAGDAAKVKLAELEDDAASMSGTSSILDVLNRVRDFCLDMKKCTFFRIDFHDKENRPAEYGVMQDLMDLRLIHLIDSSLSDEKHAGRRSEVYMLDLSQFSGQRLKKRLNVLDFKDGHIVLKQTGTKSPVKKAETPKQRLGVLRRGPLLNLGTGPEP